MTPGFSHSIKHVAFIMDGNGRWAKNRSHRRVWGHLRGAAIIPDLIEESDRLGIEKITLFSFSTENWSRPISEITTLFKILKKFLIKEEKRILNNDICFKIVGSIDRLPLETQEIIIALENKTKNAQGLKLNVAFDYGGRKEIVDAVNSFIGENEKREMKESDLEKFLYENNKQDIDLLIRTGGEKRISNFLLWQLAYAELYFTDTKWPNFTREEYCSIVKSVAKRERRFGYVTESGGRAENDLRSKKNLQIVENENNNEIH